MKRKGYRTKWERWDYAESFNYTRLRLVVLDTSYLPVRSATVTFRREHKCESVVAERMCMDMVLGGDRFGEPIRYG